MGPQRTEEPAPADADHDEERRVGPSEEDVVVVRSVSKHFGVTVALRDVSFSARRGEIVAIVGHNGAGKSTLLRCIGGFESPSRGSVTLGGRRLHPVSARAARDLGVRSVRQELSLPPSLSPVECALLDRRRAWRRGAKRKAEGDLRALFSEMFGGQTRNARQPLERSDFAVRQMWELCLAFLDSPKGCSIAVLDEATSALDSSVTEALLSWIRETAKRDGIAVLLSSHRLQEFTDLADRAVVMSEGGIVAELAGDELSVSELVARMGGGSPTRATRRDNTGNSRGAGTAAIGANDDPLLDADANLFGAGSADVRVRRGEVVGIGGLEGQGQAELLNRLFTLFQSPRRRRRAGLPRMRVALVSGDTRREGVFPYWPVCRNISIGGGRSLRRLGFVRSRLEKELVDKLIVDLRVRGGPAQNVMELSGGNQQKAVLARALLHEPELLFLNDPTRGVDVMTKQEVYDILETLAVGGAGILWYSTELDELQRCDRVYVMRAGRVSGELHGDELRNERIVELSFEQAVEVDG